MLTVACASGDLSVQPDLESAGIVEAMLGIQGCDAQRPVEAALHMHGPNHSAGSLCALFEQYSSPAMAEIAWRAEPSAARWEAARRWFEKTRDKGYTEEHEPRPVMGHTISQKQQHKNRKEY